MVSGYAHVFVPVSIVFVTLPMFKYDVQLYFSSLTEHHNDLCVGVGVCARARVCVCGQLLHVINDRWNVCRHIHLPAQSGSSRVLAAMRRGYTADAYMELVNHIRSIILGARTHTRTHTRCGSRPSVSMTLYPFSLLMSQHALFTLCYSYQTTIITQSHSPLLPTCFTSSLEPASYITPNS